MTGQTTSSPSHFHIRWSDGRLDFERFGSRGAAAESAERLVQRDETYSIEPFGDHCEKCAELFKKVQSFHAEGHCSSSGKNGNAVLTVQQNHGRGSSSATLQNRTHTIAKHSKRLGGPR